MYKERIAEIASNIYENLSTYNIDIVTKLYFSISIDNSGGFV
jgi:hypothetical protein